VFQSGTTPAQILFLFNVVVPRGVVTCVPERLSLVPSERRATQDSHTHTHTYTHTHTDHSHSHSHSHSQSHSHSHTHSHRDTAVIRGNDTQHKAAATTSRKKVAANSNNSDCVRVLIPHMANATAWPPSRTLLQTMNACKSQSIEQSSQSTHTQVDGP
jgi:hypothetical protein